MCVTHMLRQYNPVLDQWCHCPQAVSLVAAGADVARKVVILARECGLQLSLSELQVSSLVPQPLAALTSVEEFMQQLPQVREGLQGGQGGSVGATFVLGGHR